MLHEKIVIVCRSKVMQNPDQRVMPKVQKAKRPIEGVHIHTVVKLEKIGHVHPNAERHQKEKESNDQDRQMSVGPLPILPRVV